METGPWVCSASSLAMWAETKQPALLLVKVTLGPLIWAIKGAMNPPPLPTPSSSCLRSAWLENSGHSVSSLDCTETHKPANFSQQNPIEQRGHGIGLNQLFVL